MSIRIAIADDEGVVRAGLRMILEAEHDLEVAGEAADGAEAIEVVRRTQPDVALMDIRMPGTDGISGRAHAHRGGTDTRIVMLTTFDQDEYLYEALRAGTSGFLLKAAPPEQLVAAVRTVAAGRRPARPVRYAPRDRGVRRPRRAAAPKDLVRGARGADRARARGAKPPGARRVERRDSARVRRRGVDREDARRRAC